MKKAVLLFSIFLTFSFSFTSCRDNVPEANEVVQDDFETEDEIYDDEIGMNTFEDNDLDDDGLWDSDEFGEAYEEDWSTWDADGDGFLDENEFYDTSYGWVDADNDGLIEEEEWVESYDVLYSDYAAVDDFDAYDLDDDGFLDENEWVEGWNESDWFNDYDLDDDELVDNDEWNDGLFGIWDEDDDGFWDEDEYASYVSYYDTW